MIQVLKLIKCNKLNNSRPDTDSERPYADLQ